MTTAMGAQMVKMLEAHESLRRRAAIGYLCKAEITFNVIIGLNPQRAAHLEQETCTEKKRRFGCNDLQGFPTGDSVCYSTAGFTVDAVCPPRQPLGKTRAVAQICHIAAGAVEVVVEAIAASKTRPLTSRGRPRHSGTCPLYSRENRQGKRHPRFANSSERSLGQLKFLGSCRPELLSCNWHRKGHSHSSNEIISNTHDSEHGSPNGLRPKAECTSGEGVRLSTQLSWQTSLSELQAPPLLARALKLAPGRSG